MTLPQTRATACFDCPWRRVSVAGWLGPHDAMTWIRIAHGESPVACHITIPEDRDENARWASAADDGILQCRGVAIYRENVCKLPKHPEIEVGPANKEEFFSSPNEFVDHHGGELSQI